MIKKTPKSERFHIGLFGKTNSGKSSLLNALTGQEVSIVSATHGTTTDPVEKRFELLDTSPVVFIDTAGFNDDSILGTQRIERTEKTLQKTDLALILLSSKDIDYNWFKNMARECKKLSIHYLMVLTKSDLLSKEEFRDIKKTYPDAHICSIFDEASINNILEILSEHISLSKETQTLLSDKLSRGLKVMLVIPIDTEAPKGRIIHPQVQIIRECLDNGVEVTMVRDTELKESLERSHYDIDLVITDSQVFKFVSEIVPAHILLTSFSIIFSRYKGDLDYFLKGIEALDTVTHNDHIAILESCSHNISCEDIGRFKIPKALEKYLGFAPKIDFYMGDDFPNNLDKYKLLIHCGACMTNRQAILSRIKKSKDYDIPITNYGIFLAFMAGILPRAIKIFTD